MAEFDELVPFDPQQEPQQPTQDPQRRLTSDEVYDSILAKRSQQADQLAIESFTASLKTNPAKAREADRIARELGMDAGVAERKPDDVRRILAQKQYEEQQLAVWSPILRSQLADPSFAKLAHDDLPNLSAYERIAYAMERGRLTDERGRIGGRLMIESNQADIKRLAEINARLDSIPETTGWDPVGIVAGAGEIASQMARTTTEALAAGAALAGPVALLGQAGPQAALPEELITVPTAFAIGAGSVFAGRSAQVEAGTFYAEMLARGVGETWQARVGAATVGVINGALEVVGVGAVTKPVRDMMTRAVRDKVADAMVRPTMSEAAKKFARNYILGVGGEVGTEIAQEITNIVAEGAVTGQFDEKWASRLGQIAEKTAQGMLLLGLPGPAFQAAHDVREAKSAMARREVIGRQSEKAAESKLRQENPAAFQEMAEKVSDQTFYINAKDLAEAFQQRDEASNAENEQRAQQSQRRLIEQIDQLVPGLRDRISEAMQRGGDVTIPVAEFMARLSGTEAGDAMLDHVRLSPDDMSAAEAAKIDPENLADEAIKKAEEAAAAAEQWKVEAQEVEATIYEQIMATGRVKPQQAKANATLWRKFVETQAERLGETPKQLAARYPLTVAAGDVGGDAFAQPLFHGSPRLLDTLRAGSMLTDQPEWSAGYTTKDVYTETSRKEEFSGAVHQVDWKPSNPITVFGGRTVADAEDALIRHGKLHGVGDTKGGLQALARAVHEKTGKDAIVVVNPEGVTVGMIPLVDVPVSQKHSPKDVLNKAKKEGRPIAENLQKLMADKTDTPEFKAWFGDSKVVDKDGKPLRVFHGTSGAGFSAFETYATKFGLMGAGAYFTESAQVAGEYTAKGRGTTQGVYPVFLSIKRPLDMDAKGNAAEWEKAFPTMGDPEGSSNEAYFKAAVDALREDGYSGEEGATFMQDQILHVMGYDGLTHIGGGRVDPNGVKHRVWIAFEPTQIKSVNNRGAFDPNDPNILRQDGEKDLVITHNVTAEKLAHSDRLGGLPAPSLAVTKKDTPLTGFGDITLVGSPTMADPKSGTKVFGADIYSPRYPSVGYSLDKKAVDKLNEVLAPYAEKGKRAIYTGEVDSLDDLTSRPAFIAFAEKKLGESAGWGKIKALAQEVLRNAGAKERIFTGFTWSGDRRYVAHTLENVVRILKKELRGGEGFNYGVGSLRAKFTPQFRSVAQIKKEKGRLVSKDEFEKIKADIDKEFFELVELMGIGNVDTAMAVLEEAPTLGLERSAAKYQADLSAEAKQAAVEFLEKLRNLPTQYFEAKILRGVGISEFAAAVVPHDVDESALAILKKHGVQEIKTYEKGNDTDRARAIGELKHLLFQKDSGPVRGGFLMRDGKPLIVLTPDSDASTFVHETGHAFLSIYADMAAQKVHPQIVDDFRTFLKWAGVESIEAWQAMTVDQQRASHERFAREFEAYLWEGKAPTPELRSLFSRFMRFLRMVYRSLAELAGGVSPEIRSVMDRMLASERDVRVAEQVRGALPLFQTQDESGLDDEAWAKHVERMRAATDQSIDEMARKRMADMKWLGNAKAGKLREIQQQAKRVREGERIKVAAETQQQRVYRAIRWLKDGEFVNPDGTKEKSDGGTHKLDRDVVKQLLGLQELDENAEPAAPKPKAVKRGPSLVTRIKQLGGISTESWNKSFPGERKKEWRIPFMVRPTGMDWEAMASQLRSEGYGPEALALEGEGSGDNSWLVDALADAAQGAKQYSRFTADAEAVGAVEPQRAAPESEQERADRIAAEQADAEEDRARMAEVQVAKPEKALHKLRGMLVKGGIHPDDVASVFGFNSGGELVQSILDAPAIEAVIESETDRRMLDKHSRLVDPKLREETIIASLYNETRRRVVAGELAALDKASQPQRVMLAAAKKAAEVAIGKKKVGEVKPASFATAARRASKDAIDAVKRSDDRAAIEAKRLELKLQAMADMSTDVVDEIRKGVAMLAGFGEKDADLAKGRDLDFVQVGRALATAYRILPEAATPQQQAQRNEAVKRITEEWPAVAERVVGLLAEASRNGIDYKAVSVEWFRDVVATADMLWTMSRDAAQLVAEEKRRQTAEVVGGLLGQMSTLPPPPSTKALPLGGGEPLWRSGVLKFWNVVAGLKVAEHWARWMDGGKDGPFTRHIVQPIMRATTNYRARVGEITKRVHAAITEAAERSGAAWQSRIYSEELDFTFRGKAELLHALLHAGSESGLHKFLLGERGKNGAPLADVTMDEDGAEIIDTSRWDRFIAKKWNDGTLTKEDADFLTFMWGEFAKLLPDAQKAHRAQFGYEFKTIEHRKMLTPFGVLEGGYVPARINRDKAAKSSRINSVAEIEQAAQDFRYSVGPAKGFTKERNENYRQPLSLDLGKLLAHMDEEAKFIYLGPAVGDVMRILNGKASVVDEAGVAREVKFRDALSAYDRETVDGLLLPWLQNTALQRTTRPGMSAFTDAAAKALRSASSLMALGFNLSNSLLQLTGLSTASTQVRGKFIRSAALHWIKNPVGAFREMAGASQAMAQRYDQQTRLLTEEVQRTAMGPLAAGKDATKKALARWAFLPQRMFQMVVDTVTWHAARQEAVANGAGVADAIESADGAVRRSQGNPNPEGKARYAASTPFVQLFTQFGDYSNTMLNVIMSAQSRSKALLWALLLPAIMEGALRMWMRPPEDDDNDGLADELAAGMGKSVLRSVTGMVPVVGPFAFTLADSEGQRVMESPASGVLKEAYLSVMRLLDDDTKPEAEVRAWANLLTLMGFPVAAPVRTVQTLTSDR